MSTNYQQVIAEALPHCLVRTEFNYGQKYQGKVRDTYDLGDQLLLITTDRQSAFDKVIAAIPCKGQVLNLTSAWWFKQTESIVPNHMIALPDPNVMLAKKCKVFPIEFVVRGYITGTTNTSLWTQYNSGKREYCGIQFADGLQKNQRLAQPILTPTTKETVHDRPISPTEIIAEGWMSEADWLAASEKALALFSHGAKIAAKNGLILVDTKYEFGVDLDGQITLVDEIHTPDSSRYWLSKSYAERFAAGLEPENIDKEFLRLWFVKNCNPYEDQVLPEAPEDLVITLASRYIQLYEMITQNSFSFEALKAGSAQERIQKNLVKFLG